MERLAPPGRWAGSARAVEFVQSLGFSAEWAGQRGARRAPYLEVDGPFSLPPLHAYQRLIVAKVRDMLCNGHSVNGKRRGMISLPTGSGKTRVAVQAIVEAIRHGCAATSFVEEISSASRRNVPPLSLCYRLCFSIISKLDQPRLIFSRQFA